MKPAFTIWPKGIFREKRDYYHSTDLYNTLDAELKIRGFNATSFDLRIKEKIINHPRIEFFHSKSSEQEERPAASCEFVTSGGKFEALCFNGVDPITESKPYLESTLYPEVLREGARFSIFGCYDFSPIEIVTSVAVFAHKCLYPPPEGARWLLGQISANRLLGYSEHEYFRLEIVRRLGARLVQSNMFDKTGNFGTMLFILK